MKKEKSSKLLEAIHNAPDSQNLSGLMEDLGSGKLFNLAMELYIMLLEAIQLDPEGVVNGSMASQMESFLEALNNNLTLTEEELKTLAPLVAILIVAIKSSTLAFLFNHPETQMELPVHKSKFLN